MTRSNIYNSNKLIWPLTIVIASLILGSFIFTSQLLKQRSIERQQATETASEREAVKERKRELESCLNEAKSNIDEMEKDYCILEKKEIREDGGCYLSKARVDYLNERYDEAKDVCFKRFPQQ